MTSDLTLDEVARRMERNISLFHKFWLEQHALHPDMYPLEMGEADWADQFEAWFEIAEYLVEQKDDK